jgi:hypothetical protein
MLLFLVLLLLAQNKSFVPATDVSFKISAASPTYKINESVTLNYRVTDISNAALFVPHEWEVTCPAGPHLWAWFEDRSGHHLDGTFLLDVRCGLKSGGARDYLFAKDPKMHFAGACQPANGHENVSPRARGSPCNAEMRRLVPSFYCSTPTRNLHKVCRRIILLLVFSALAPDLNDVAAHKIRPTPIPTATPCAFPCNSTHARRHHSVIAAPIT